MVSIVYVATYYVNIAFLYHQIFTRTIYSSQGTKSFKCVLMLIKRRSWQLKKGSLLHGSWTSNPSSWKGIQQTYLLFSNFEDSSTDFSNNEVILYYAYIIASWFGQLEAKFVPRNCAKVAYFLASYAKYIDLSMWLEKTLVIF